MSTSENYEVKEALKNGLMKKRYMFSVGHFGPGFNFIDEVGVPPGEGHIVIRYYQAKRSGRYRLYAYYQDFEIQVVTPGGGYYNEPTYDGTKYYYEVDLESNVWVYITSGVYSIYVEIWSDSDYSFVEDFSIGMDNLVAESVSLDERLCSVESIKFGLCEGSELCFQYFGFQSIKGDIVLAKLATQTGWYRREYPMHDEEKYSAYKDMGIFKVKECTRQVSTGIYKVKAYNILADDDLDETITADDLKGRFSADYSLNVDNMYLSPFDIIPGSFLNSLYMARWMLSIEVETRSAEILWPDPTVPYTMSDTGPINEYRYPLAEDPEGTTPRAQRQQKLYFHFVRCYDFAMAVEPWNFVAQRGDLSQLDRNLFEALCTIFAESTSADGTVMSLLAGNIWPMYILLRESSYRYYSTMQYEYDKVHWPLAIRVQGTLADMNLLQSSSRDSSVCDTYVPAYISNSPNWGEGVITPIMYFSQLRTYEYRDPITQEIKTAEFPYWKYSDERPVNSPIEFTGGFKGAQYLPLISLEYVGLPKFFDRKISISDIADYTERELLSASYELMCCFGIVSRGVNFIRAIELTAKALYPSDSLLPSDSLYPNGFNGSTTMDAPRAAERIDGSMYEKLWIDEKVQRKFRNLYIIYRGYENESETPPVEVEKVYEKVVNSEAQGGTDDYYVDDNWYLKNLIWSESDIASIANTMADKMRNIEWVPFELWCAGLPYLEVGDMLELTVGDQTYVSHILRRTLKGIHNMHDEIMHGSVDVF